MQPPPPPTPPSVHSNFFSSLKQVEKRLKSEHPSNALHPSSQGEDSLTSPMYLHLEEEPINSSSSTFQENSEPPLVFLSCSPQFPQTLQNPPHKLQSHHPKSIFNVQIDPVDEIQQLIQILGLEDFDNGKAKTGREMVDEELRSDCGGDSCHCESGFYAKIVGMKGPKCGKEVERLNGWIEYFFNGEEEKLEPLRLAYLLLGKAAFASGGCFEGLEFPSNIEDFLLNDPPTK